MKNKTKLDLLLSNLKDFNVYCEEDGKVEILEDLEDIYCLFYEIELQIYNGHITEAFDQEWKNSIRDIFIIKKDDTRVYMKEFAELVYSDNDEWRIEGDKKYIE